MIFYRDVYILHNTQWALTRGGGVGSGGAGRAGRGACARKPEKAAEREIPPTPHPRGVLDILAGYFFLNAGLTHRYNNAIYRNTGRVATSTARLPRLCTVLDAPQPCESTPRAPLTTTATRARACQGDTPRRGQRVGCVPPPPTPLEHMRHP